MLSISFMKRIIGQCFMELGKHDKAIESFHESIRIREVSVGSEKQKRSSYGYTTSKHHWLAKNQSVVKQGCYLLYFTVLILFHE